MIPAAAVALLLATAIPGGLDEARRAFAAGDHPSAERLALEAAAAGGPDEAAARYLAGLASFRAGRPAEALALLDASPDGADAAAAWHFNRGACLYELGRNGEAEAAFLEAARDPAFEALALVNAGFAALDAGAPGRARALAARARAVGGPATALVDELEQALAAGDGASTSAPAPAAPPASTPPPGSTAGPAAASPWSFSAGAGAELGYDDDALRAGTGAVERPGTVARVGSGVALAWLGGEARLATGGLTLAAGYGAAHAAYLAAAAEDHGTQQHEVLLALRGSPAGPLWLELALTGQYALAGSASLRGLQAAGGARLSAALELAPGQVTRAELSFAGKDGQGAEFASLDGSRLEAAASHEARLGWLTASGGYRFRLERIGEVRTALPPLPSCAGVGCSVTEVEPLSYQAHGGWLAARVEPAGRLRLELLVGIEGRLGLEDVYTLLEPLSGAPPMRANVRRRSDLRGFGGEALTWHAAPFADLTLRHEWLANHTTLGRTAGGAGGPGRGGAESTWDKHVVTAGLSVTW